MESVLHNKKIDIMSELNILHGQLKANYPVPDWQEYGFSLISSDNVYIGDFLIAKGFVKTIETERRRKWETYRHPSFEIGISIRDKSEWEPGKTYFAHHFYKKK
jgi:hypothetical protein